MQFRHGHTDVAFERWFAFELPAVAEGRRRRELYEAKVAGELSSRGTQHERTEAVRRGVRVGRQMALAIWSLLVR